MIRKVLTAMMALLFVQVLFAQNIAVENFKHHKKFFWQRNSSLPVDKKSAAVLFKVKTKGFDFKTANGSPIVAEEGDDGVLLKVSDKTKYIVISHPEFGEYDWRVPLKYLKKHNFYTAELVVRDLTKEYKNPNQWIVFNISPENAILTLDSVMYRVTDGQISLYLPIGNHSYQLESPFYEEVADSIVLTDSVRIEKNIYLQPVYSYLSVKTEDPEMEIFVDEKQIGTGEVTVGRIEKGNHRLSLLKNNHWVKDTVISIDRAEKKTIFVPEDLRAKNLRYASEKLVKNPAPDIYREKIEVKTDPILLVKELKTQKNEPVIAKIHLIAEDSLTNIFIDREIVGTGEWTGELSRGFHLISTEKDSLESVSQYIEIIDNSPRDIILTVPHSSVGMVNVTSNVTGAQIIVEDDFYGLTPSVISGLKADELHTITIRKNGYKDKSVVVRPQGNNLVEVFVELKKLKS